MSQTGGTSLLLDSGEIAGVAKAVMLFGTDSMLLTSKEIRVLATETASVEAFTSLVVVVGGNSISIGKDFISLETSGTLSIKAKEVTIAASSKVTVSGANVNVDSGVTTVTAGVIKLNA